QIKTGIVTFSPVGPEFKDAVLVVITKGEQVLRFVASAAQGKIMTPTKGSLPHQKIYLVQIIIIIIDRRVYRIYDIIYVRVFHPSDLLVGIGRVRSGIYKSLILHLRFFPGMDPFGNTECMV